MYICICVPIDEYFMYFIGLVFHREAPQQKTAWWDTLPHTATPCDTKKLVHTYICIWYSSRESLQHSATRCNAQQHTATHCLYIYIGTYVYVHLIDEYFLYFIGLLQCVAVCCSVLQCVAGCCRVLQGVTFLVFHRAVLMELKCLAVCCSATLLQCVAGCQISFIS